MSKLIVGLGNPGSQYENTRHNVGFCVIDQLLAQRNLAQFKNVCQSLVAEQPDPKKADHKLIFAKPMTYMNHSGVAVSMLVEKYGIDLEKLCVLYDDLNLDLGVLRCRRSGTHGGQKGMQSIIKHLDSDAFSRIRIGIGKPSGEFTDHVLAKFSDQEIDEIKSAISQTAEAVEIFITDGIDVTMNQFNGKTNPAD
ncbi:TPA: aminoacyl-tRNA hydrolase [Candidatus Poribacteria bacterium]|nr:aminoacyl-tRNA hydrolase [Candidatus Poribacteria bacterium]HIM09247.1 aminoacyl-tRNA hydrolase [Candidatus Poribacteria bacterium]